MNGTKVFVFGNKENTQDSKAFTVAKKLKSDFPDVDFIEAGTNFDLPPEFQTSAIILDTVYGIKKVELIVETDVERLIPSKSSTVHDFDLGFQLSYLKKLGKLGHISIIGIPTRGGTNYLRIQSILRKLVAQDMQGS